MVEPLEHVDVTFFPSHIVPEAGALKSDLLIIQGLELAGSILSMWTGESTRGSSWESQLQISFCFLRPFLEVDLI